MKNLLIIFLISLFFIGCASKTNIAVIDFETVDKSYKFSLSSQDHFDTAVMIDQVGNKKILKSSPSASGIRMTDETGTVVHFKNGYGVMNLNGGKDIKITYKK